MPGIYIISNPKHLTTWKEYRASGIPIISSWIDDMECFKPRYKPEWLLREQEMYRASCVFVYSSANDLQIDSLLDIGMAMGYNKTIFALGTFKGYTSLINHPYFSLKPFPEWDITRTLKECHNWDRTGIADELRTANEKSVELLSEEVRQLKQFIKDQGGLNVI